MTPTIPYHKILCISVWIYSSKLLHELRQEAACCLGLLCAALSYEAERIFKWMFLKFSVSTKDEVKLLYLVAVHKALETAGEKKAFSAVMQVFIQLSFFFYNAFNLFLWLKSFTVFSFSW